MGGVVCSFAVKVYANLKWSRNIDVRKEGEDVRPTAAQRDSRGGRWIGMLGTGR
jgi:hypothetical protein